MSMCKHHFTCLGHLWQCNTDGIISICITLPKWPRQEGLGLALSQKFRNSSFTCNFLPAKLPGPPSPSQECQHLGLSLIKNPLPFKSNSFNYLLIKPFDLCINIFACLKINQYSTGLSVGCSSKNPIAGNRCNLIG